MHIRTRLINEYIVKYNYKSYLEIGVDDCVNFNSIEIQRKVSVDPNDTNGLPTYKMESSEFYKINRDVFDIIFIDGLHIFDTCYNDLIESLKILNNGGIILLHDTFPKKYEHQTVPPSDPCWTGDVWKVVLKAQINLLNINIKTFDLESGITIITKNKTSRLINKNLKEIYEYEYFKDNYKEILNLELSQNVENYLDTTLNARLNIALLQNHTGHYYRIQHLINTLKIKNNVVEIKKIEDIHRESFDALLIEYYSSYTSNVHKEMCERMNSYKEDVMKFKGKIILYNVDDGQGTHISELDIDIAYRIDAWVVYMKHDRFLNSNLLIENIISNKLVLIPRYTLPYVNSSDVIYENKQNKIVFIGNTTGNYWFNGKNWRVECLNRIWDNKFLREHFDGWLVNDHIIDVSHQDEDYNKTFKFVKKNYYLPEADWYNKLKNNTVSLCIPGHTKYGYRHPQSMTFKSTMLANFDLELDPYPWLFSDKLKDISYVVKDDLSNFNEICEESVLDREKTKMYAYNAYDVYKTYLEPTIQDTYQAHVWSIVKEQFENLNINDL